MKKLRRPNRMERNIVLLAAALIAAAGVGLSVTSAHAVPAFARKYNLSCNACHTREPRLNPFGQQFMENGYQVPDSEDGGRTEKHLFGTWLDGATIDDDVSNYIAVRLRADVQKAHFRERTEATDDVDIVFPNIINVYFAGTAAKNISFFIEGEYATQEGHEAALGFHRAFLIFDNLGGHQAANFKIGQFDPSAFFSFPTHRQQLNPIPPEAHTDDFPPEINRMPLLPFAFSTKMFGLTTGPANETVDGYSILPFEPYLFNAPVQTGAAVYGRPFGENLLYLIGVAQNETAEDVPDKRNDPYIMLRYDIVRGDYSAFQVSGFYYRAEKAARPTLAGPVYAVHAVDWDRYGIGARWQYRYFDIYGTVVWDKIDAPVFAAAPASLSKWDTDGLGVSIEADWIITTHWLLGVRYDFLDPGGLEELPPALQAGDPKINQDASFLGVIGKYYPTPNISLYARAHVNLEDSVKLPTNVFGGAGHPARNLKSMYTVGVDMAF